MRDSIIGKMEDLIENPGNASEIVNDPVFDEHNLTSPNFYIEQTELIVKDSQNAISTTTEKYLGIPEEIAQPIGIIVPCIIIMLYIYLLSKTIIQNMKVVAIISIIVILGYGYFTFI